MGELVKHLADEVGTLRERAEAAEKACRNAAVQRDDMLQEAIRQRKRAEAAEAALRAHEAVWEHAEGCMAGCEPEAGDWCEVARDLSREAAVLRRKVLDALEPTKKAGGR